MAPEHWHAISSRQILDVSPWFSVIEDTLRLPSGRVVNDFYRIEAPNYVLIAARTDEKRFVLERHYKHYLGQIILTSPTKTIETGEKALDAAKRELLEETGYVADKWYSMGAFTVDGTRGICRAHLFLADGIRMVAELMHNDMEEFEFVSLTVKEIKSAIRLQKILLLPDVALLTMATNDLFADC